MVCDSSTATVSPSGSIVNWYVIFRYSDEALG